MTFEAWLTKASMTKPADMRYGQWLFNSLSSIRPDLTARCRTTDNDPFYNDDRVAGFLAWVARSWEDGDIGALVEPNLWRTARQFCADTPLPSEYVRGQAELLIDLTPGINMDDKERLMAVLVQPYSHHKEHK